MILDSKYTSAEHLPSSIDREPVKSLAKTWDDMLAEFMNTNTLLLWSSIDTEPETVIDHLAYQLHVDDYDSGLPIETKREMVKNSIDIHFPRYTAPSGKILIEVNSSNEFNTI